MEPKKKFCKLFLISTKLIKNEDLNIIIKSLTNLDKKNFYVYLKKIISNKILAKYHYFEDWVSKLMLLSNKKIEKNIFINNIYCFQVLKIILTNEYFLIEEIPNDFFYIYLLLKFLISNLIVSSNKILFLGLMKLNEIFLLKKNIIKESFFKAIYNNLIYFEKNILINFLDLFSKFFFENNKNLNLNDLYDIMLIIHEVKKYILDNLNMFYIQSEFIILNSNNNKFSNYLKSILICFSHLKKNEKIKKLILKLGNKFSIQLESYSIYTLNYCFSQLMLIQKIDYPSYFNYIFNHYSKKKIINFLYYINKKENIENNFIIINEFKNLDELLNFFLSNDFSQISFTQFLHIFEPKYRKPVYLYDFSDDKKENWILILNKILYFINNSSNFQPNQRNSLNQIIFKTIDRINFS